MGAKVDVPKNAIAEAKLALAQGMGFGTAAESGNHPHRPQTTRLDYEDLPEWREQAFANACKKLGLHPIFYDIRLDPSEKTRP